MSRGLAQLNARRAAARRQRISDIAEQMAEGCPTVKEVSRRMMISQTEADKCWQAIRKSLGWQAV